MRYYETVVKRIDTLFGTFRHMVNDKNYCCKYYEMGEGKELKRDTMTPLVIRGRTRW
jgi:hypothetical protein